jgi:hypothetical protein
MPRPTKRSDLQRWIAQHHPAAIGESEFDELRTALAPISENYLRHLLRDSGVALDPLVEGVRQGSFDELQQSLEHLLAAYEAGDRMRQQAVRRLVITAKDHARLAAHSKRATPEKRGEKEEMLLWLLTWLENPGVFREWAALRRLAWQKPKDDAERPVSS